MNLNLKRGRIANRISLGDGHDLSVEWFITHTNEPFYVIERIGERFRIRGAEAVKEEPNNVKTDEEKPEPAKTKSRIGGYRGRNKSGK